ncbi:related to general amino acid permease [Phialocephala subalpina]|uniref:Related to general amino acid permease n=1 Tax=Phialocephala subalpina TaxID=576137 RepID=A0A1L7X4E6_9HELO|nr:related to general amino acid permease [Phialocephala subalpina]
MSESPVSDPEKHAYPADNKAVYNDATPVYADEALGETEVVEFTETKELRRGLHQRHIQMIALAGTIGTGLFLGSGKAIANGGPLGALLGYSFVGVLVIGVVLSIAELSALLPLSGAIIRHAEHFVDPALSFAQGWNSIYSSLVSLPAELVAAAVIVQFWSTVSPAVWITIFGLLLVCSNLLFVRVYGEMEFTFASLKIMLIIGLNIMALVIVCGGGPDHHRYGFQFWRNPGPFVDYLGYTGSLGHFMGFWTTFSNAVYAYSGIENISIAAAETQSPRRNIPIAAKRIFWRVVIFYVLSIFFVGLIVPSNDENLLHSTGTAAQSPFVIAASNAGIKVVPSIINFVVLTSAWSAGNSGLLGSSRTLYGMAREGHAPKIFLRTNRMGIPYVAVLFMSLWICLGYMTLSDSASTVFGWLQDLVSVSALVGWMVICTVYLRFYYACKKQGIDRSELPWKAPFQPYAAWLSLISFTVLLLTGGYVTFIHGHWENETFVSSYINIPIILILYFSYKFIKKTKIIPLSEVPIRHFIDIANANPEPPAEPVTGIRRFNILWS